MRVTFLILAGVVMSACAGTDGSQGYTETDSAGVTIVENGRSRMARAEGWSLQAVPDLEIVPGEVQGPALSQVAGLALLPGEGGRVAVLNQGSHEVLLFREGGEILARFGREGDGPGGFRQMTSLVPMAGDSIGVYDSSLMVLSVFDSQGKLSRSVSLGDAVQGRFHSLLLPLPGGDMVFFTVSGPGVGFREGVFRASTESLRIGPGGERRAGGGDRRDHGDRLLRHGGGAGADRPVARPRPEHHPPARGGPLRSGRGRGASDPAGDPAGHLLPGAPSPTPPPVSRAGGVGRRARVGG